MGGREAIEALRGGQRVRAVVQALPSHPEHDLYDLIAQAVAAALESGRGSVVVVPDHKTLERAQRAVEAVVEPQLVARLHSEHIARVLLRRYGVVCWRLLEREASWLPPWRDR